MHARKIIPAFHSFIAAVCVMTFFSCGSNDPVKQADARNDAKFSGTDDEKNSAIMVDAAGLLLQDIELAKLAQNNSIKNDVRKTGRQLELEYTQAYSLLKKIATEKTVTLPAEVSSSDKKTDTDISYEISDKFDDRYFELTKADHKKAIDLFEKIKSQSTLPALGQWAENTLILYRKNLESITALEQRIAVNKPNPKTL